MTLLCNGDRHGGYEHRGHIVQREEARVKRSISHRIPCFCSDSLIMIKPASHMIYSCRIIDVSRRAAGQSPCILVCRGAMYSIKHLIKCKSRLSGRVLGLQLHVTCTPDRQTRIILMSLLGGDSSLDAMASATVSQAPAGTRASHRSHPKPNSSPTNCNLPPTSHQSQIPVAIHSLSFFLRRARSKTGI
jgi:hypothetical protein